MIKFLIDIAIIHTLFYIIWNYGFSFIMAVVTTLAKLDIWGIRLTKGLGAIVFASLCSLVVINHSQDNDISILYSIIAGILLFLNLVGSTSQARNSLQRETDYIKKLKLEAELELDYIYWIIALVAFVLALYIPILSANPINYLFIYISEWLMSIKFVNWLITGASVFLIISLTLKGIFGLFVFTSLLQNKRT